MTASQDLVLLVADKDIEMALTGILGRHHSIGMRAIECRFEVDPEHDPGCLRRAHDILRSHVRRFHHALVVFDHHGCGNEGATREILEAEMEARLTANGWEGRAAAVVISPELEQWAWSDSPEVDRALGWVGRSPDLRAWLRNRSLLASDAVKPGDPKLAWESALREARRPRSSARFRQLGDVVSFTRCSDPAFHKLLATLRRWFPPAA